MEAVADNRVSDIAIKCSAQSSKTQTFLNLACWCVSEDPGPAMWVMAAKDEAETFVRDRVAPTFKNCRPVEGAKIRESKLEFTFATMPFYFVGAGSPSKLQSKPIRWLFLDEVRNYPPGALDTVLKRTRSFWNSRRLIISTPDLENDAVDRAYEAGDQRVFHFVCPGRSQLQPLKFEQLKWESNETTKPGETIRYACVSCGHAIKGHACRAQGDCPERALRANQPSYAASPRQLPLERAPAAVGVVALHRRGIHRRQSRAPCRRHLAVQNIRQRNPGRIMGRPARRD